MRIAQVAPLAESVPPKLYGGTERVVSWLTEELVRHGHHVTLFASGDSNTKAELVPVVPRALRLDPNVRECLPHNLCLIDAVRARADEFDVIHFHVDLLHYPSFRDMADRVVTTLHGQLDFPDLHAFYREFAEMPLVSISHSQRAPMPPVNWLATVHHGMPKDLYRPRSNSSGDYFAFVGRICPEKGIEDAIDIAERMQIPLKIGVKVDNVDRAYFEARVKPRLSSPWVEFIGEVNDRQKNELMGNALATLFPICWPEPFGLVMIESMACGTPVIAYKCGSVPEIIEEGVTGFIVKDVDTAVAAAKMASSLDRNTIRRRFEYRFTVEQMTTKYLDVYARLMDARLGAVAAA
ncbi:MAG TPA: glycosyltransferase family 4 protein [Rhizomicrobium sp.]|jgi:glycosyltransferase involved in cell wall biosynthesis|nr:glycosyltransferase family 4 protein [Rhizomicrobium sp.]